MNQIVLMQFTADWFLLGDNEYLSISEYFEVEKVLEAEESGVSWLDTVEHLLEFYGDSRTDAVSGHVVFELK